MLGRGFSLFLFLSASSASAEVSLRRPSSELALERVTVTDLGAVLARDGGAPVDADADAGDDDGGEGEAPRGGSSPPPWTPPPLSNDGDSDDWEDAVPVALFGCAASTEPAYEDDEWDWSEACGSSEGYEDDGYDDESCDSDDYAGSEESDESEGCEQDPGYYEDSDEEEECSIVRRRRRRPRPKLSVYALALAAIALPIRRWARAGRNGAKP